MYEYNNILSKQKNKEDFETLKRHFVLVPVDKAENNVAIICKKYYIETLVNKLASRTFKKVDTTSNDFIENAMINL